MMQAINLHLPITYTSNYQFYHSYDASPAKLLMSNVYLYPQTGLPTDRDLIDGYDSNAMQNLGTLQLQTNQTRQDRIERIMYPLFHIFIVI